MIKKIIGKSVNYAGYQISPLDKDCILDLTQLSFDNPLEIAYKTKSKSCLVNLPLDRGRQLGLFSFPLVYDGGNWSPFVKTLIHYGSVGHHSYKDSYLQQYYNNCMPASASDMYGVATRYFDNIAPLGAIKLNEDKIPEARIAKKIREINNVSRRFKTSINVDEGYHHWGPVSPRKGELELTRLIETYESIKKMV